MGNDKYGLGNPTKITGIVVETLPPRITFLKSNLRPAPLHHLPMPYDVLKNRI